MPNGLYFNGALIVLEELARFTPNHHFLTLFSVVDQGALVAEQENLPELVVTSSGTTTWTWAVTDVQGFQGNPTFWISTQDPNNTAVGRLHWAGIHPQDWELGRLGTVVIECRGASGVTEVVTVEVATRSMDARDITFFTPRSLARLDFGAESAWGRYQVNVHQPTSQDRILAIDALVAEPDETGVTFSLDPEQASPLFEQARDSWVDLEVRVGGFSSLFRLRVAIRPLRIKATDQFPCAANLVFVQGKTIGLGIEGEPSVPNGFQWDVQQPDFTRFKGTPSLAPLGRGAAVMLDLSGVNDWDWINGTRGGTAELLVRDGRRPAVRLPVVLDLEPSLQRFTLTEGTKLVGPAGEMLEIAADGQFLPVGMTGDPDAEIQLQGVPLRAQQEGADANLPGSTTLSFLDAPPLLSAVVVQSAGLTRGADVEDDVRLRDRVRILWADPPAHGNRSHVLQLAWQTTGVDRAFIYPPFALDGLDGLGRVGLALVAPGRRAGVGRQSSLAEDVRARLAAQGSYTADYVIMDVDDRGDLDADGKGACHVDLEVQIKLADEGRWSWPARENIVVSAHPDPRTLGVFHDSGNAGRQRDVFEVLSGIAQGDLLRIDGHPVTVAEVNPQDFELYLADDLTDEHGNLFPGEHLVGARIYPQCPVQAEVEEAIRSVFNALGTSEAPKPSVELPWQRRYPLTTFLYPDELRLSEIVNQLMDVTGISDLRILAPDTNVAPPQNSARTRTSGERVYTAFILSLRRLMVGPYRPTPGVDAAQGYSGPA